LEVTITNELHPLVRKRLTEVVQLLQVYARLAELEIAAGEKPRVGEVALPENTAGRAKEWAEGEAQREAVMKKLGAAGKDPRAALEAMGG
jgi:hypothetical protein